jgi:hypothetical protein
MHRVGPANWWYPAWLDTVTPHVSIEPPDKVTAPEIVRSKRRVAGCGRCRSSTG